jgi:arsenical-resistance protein 2
VIFHCSSSNGRGPRCAGWYQDALDENHDDKSTTTGNRSKAYVLTGGIKAWKSAYPDDVQPL